MPRQKAPPRLYLHPARGWVIRDGAAMRGTGCSKQDREGAERALENYLAEKRGAARGPSTARELMIADALALYGAQRGDQIAAPETLAYSIQALLGFWRDRPIAAIKGETCRAYAKARGVSNGTVRRELGVLRAAIRHCLKEGVLTEDRLVTMPEAPPPRERWLTLPEAARLVRAAKPWPHLQRFILIGLYTGSRSGAIRGLQWLPNGDGGHVDLERGLLFREPAMKPKTKKRAPPAPLPRQLWAHLRRWQGTSRRWIVEHNGKPMLKTPQNSWRQARDAAGLDVTVTPHILRHTAATWMLQRGADIDQAAGILGMNAATLRSVYGHHHPDFMESARRALER